MKVDPTLVDRARPEMWKDAREKEETRRGLVMSAAAEEVFDVMERMGVKLPQENERVSLVYACIVGTVGRLLDRELPPLPAEGTPVDRPARAA